jgi:hypothetical protein
MIAFVVAGAAACGGEEAFTPQLASTERLIESAAVATLAKDDEGVEQVVVVGDLDGDGIEDAVVQTLTTTASPDPDARYQLTAYIAYGGSALRGELDLPSLPSLTEIHLGFGVVAPVGDVDGDGLSDMLVGRQRRLGCGDPPYPAPSEEATFSGAYLVYGSRTRWTGANRIGDVGVFLRDVRPCTQANLLTGLGDLDGDGFADFAIGQTPWFVGETADVYVFYGRSVRFAAGSLDTADAVIRAPSSAAGTSLVLERVGDVDGDGRGDFMVAVTHVAGPNPVSMVRGSAQRLAGVVAPDAIAQVQAAVQFGVGPRLLSPLGDLDGDGFDDFAMHHGPGGGRDYRVFYGSAAGFPAQLDVGSEAATIHGAGVSWSEIAGGDVDGDGARDLVVSDAAAHELNGAVHVLRGNGTRLSGTIDLATRGTSYIGRTQRLPNCDFAISPDCTSYELVGHSLAVGDLTGDHRADFLVSAPASASYDAVRSVPGSAPGHTYLVAPGR